MKNVVVLTGAGMSAESGLNTFRDKNGWWKQLDPTNLATPEAFKENPQLVLDFYNYRRKKVISAKPNLGHIKLVELEKKFNVNIITQNIDDLHERAGSSKVLHLHGEILKSRSTIDSDLIYKIKGSELNLGVYCEKGSQLRPHVVWFGESVPEITNAIQTIQIADILVIIGTSLVVYPAAGLISYTKPNIPIFVINPQKTGINSFTNITYIEETAINGINILEQKLKQYE